MKPRPRVKGSRPPRKPYVATEPVQGGCRWACQPGTTHDGVLVISAHTKRGVVRTAYVVQELSERDRLLGYRLHKPDGAFHDIDVTTHPWHCDCGDAEFQPARPLGCKHVRGLKAAFAALEIGSAR
jgi:hypothetical protein